MSASSNPRLDEFKRLLQDPQQPPDTVRVLRFITTMAKTNDDGRIDSEPVVQVAYTLRRGDKTHSYTEYLRLDPANDDMMNGSDLWPLVEPMLKAKEPAVRAELVHRSGSF